MEPPVVVLFDANVLFSAPLRDLLLRLAEAGIVRPQWSNVIHDEWTRNVLKRDPALSPERIARTKTRMDDAFPDALVTGFEAIVPTLVLPDVDDRHVLAAATHAECEFIVTFNLSDFPIETLELFRLRAIHPDDLVASFVESAPTSVLAAAKRQRATMRNPPKSVDEFLEALARSGLVKTVARLRPFATSL